MPETKEISKEISIEELVHEMFAIFEQDPDKYLERFSELIAERPDNSLYYLFRASIYKNQKQNHGKAIEDYTKLIELNPTDADHYTERANCYFQLKKYDEAISDYECAHKLNPHSKDIIDSLVEAYFEIRNYEKAYEYFQKIPSGIYNETARRMVDIATHFANKAEYDKALHIYEEIKYSNLPDLMDIDIEEEIRCILKKIHQQEKARAILDERNKIIADLSHSIKNLIRTIIDPLENLKEEKTVQPAVIQNALRGANLIREIVNAMNLSYTGSMEDFYYDARHNAGKDSMDLQEILVKSLLYAVGNMFDGKYFSNFVRRYFPSKSSFEEAKAEWPRVSQVSDLHKIIPFLKKYFFETKFDLENANRYAIGNEKGSAVKLLILFQEIILNAVKYSAWVSKEPRFLRIRFTANPEQMSIRVENRFKEKALAKTSGLGHVIIENFAKLLRTEPLIRREEGIYSVEINFENFWEKKTE